MAVYHGKSASVKKNDVAVINITEWTIESSLEVVDVTDFGDTYKASIVGFATWTGSFSGHADPENTQQAAFRTACLGGNQVTDAKFFIDATHYLSGNIYITGFSISTSVTDVAKTTFNFTGDGQLSYI